MTNIDDHNQNLTVINFKERGDSLIHCVNYPENFPSGVSASLAYISSRSFDSADIFWSEFVVQTRFISKAGDYLFVTHVLISFEQIQFLQRIFIKSYCYGFGHDCMFARPSLNKFV